MKKKQEKEEKEIGEGGKVKRKIKEEERRMKREIGKRRHRTKDK